MFYVWFLYGNFYDTAAGLEPYTSLKEAEERYAELEREHPEAEIAIIQGECLIEK